MVATANRKPDVFDAISHPARRQMLDLLLDANASNTAEEADLSVNAITGRFRMSRPAVSQHLRVLRRAGLVSERRQGRERRYRLVAERLTPVRDWLTRYERFWDHHLQRLQNLLNKKKPS